MKLNSSEEGAFLFCLFLVDSVFFENSFDTLTDRFHSSEILTRIDSCFLNI